MACLVLNFDINKTIIMSDIGAGRDIFGTLNSLLSECVWGIFDATIPKENRAPIDWVVCCDSPSVDPPVTGAVTFGAYLEDHTCMAKKERTAIKTTFTNSGCIGEKFRPYLLGIQSAMMVQEKREVPSSCEDLFQSEYYHILPSFFAAVQYLVQHSVNFRIVFRTFGVDIPSIAKEFNLFCEGRHPYFPLPYPIDGTNVSYPYDLRLHIPQGSGKLLRTGDGPNGIQLAYVSHDQTTQIAQGYEAVDDVIRKEWLRVDPLSSAVVGKTQYTVAIRDDFPWWHNVNNESCTSGKLCLVDRHSTTSHTVEVFFDDNIERDRAHIVDVRDRATFESVPFSESIERHFLHKVEPYSAIVDHNYFVDIIKRIVADNPLLVRSS